MKSRVTALRKSRHQSQRMLADRLGTSQQTISRIENDIYKTPVDLLMKLSSHFNVTVDYLLELTDIPGNVKSDNKGTDKFNKYYEFILEYDRLSEENRTAVRNLTRNLLNMTSVK